MVPHVLQHVAEAHLIFVILINKVHFAAIINVVRLCSTVSRDMKVLFLDNAFGLFVKISFVILNRIM